MLSFASRDKYFALCIANCITLCACLSGAIAQDSRGQNVSPHAGTPANVVHSGWVQPAPPNALTSTASLAQPLRPHLSEVGLVQEAPQLKPPALGSPSDRDLVDSDAEADADESETESGDEAASDTESEATESLKPLQDRKLSLAVTPVSISMDGLGTGEVPELNVWEGSGKMMLPDGYARGALPKCVHWRPSMLSHYPLYFEDAMLERHGQVRWGHLQPLASGVKFFSTLTLYPYLRTLQPPCECRYALGHYRPGSCAPVLKDHLPWDRRAAAVETLALASFFWAAPL